MDYNVVFADKAFQSINLQKQCSVADRESIQENQYRPQTSTIGLTLKNESDSDTIDEKQFNELLGSKNDGPVVKTIKRKEIKVFLSFKDALERGKAKDILGAKQEGKDVSTTIREVFTL